MQVSSSDHADRGAPKIGLTSPLPVVVDLDGTLARVDTLHEQVVRLALRRPWVLLPALLALFTSRAAFKARLAACSRTPGAPLPLNVSVVQAVQAQPSSPVLLCTASNQAYVSRLAQDWPFITEVVGSDATTNLKGPHKAAALRQRFGDRGFHYFGNDDADLAVWQHAGKATVVSDDPRLVARARAVCPEVEHLPPRRPPLVFSLLRTLRPHQWVKNLLLFVPILTSHRFTELPLLLLGAVGFVLFCLLSSAVYVLNDAIDLDADRLHPTKRRRPFAAGDLSVLWALPLAFGLIALSLGLAATLTASFALFASVYLVVALLYSAGLKKVAHVDVYVLAGLYTLRLFAGGALTGIPISGWLTAFSLAIFLSLALCKRFTELRQAAPLGDATLARRGYRSRDLRLVWWQGGAAMGVAVSILAVYLQSETVALLYASPRLLWGAVAIVAIWGARLWALAGQGRLPDDPVLFALRDAVSWACLLGLFAVLLVAMW